MGWGRFKPFWQSKAWKESAENDTGFFSWANSDFANFLDPSGKLDQALGQLTADEKARLAGQATQLPSATEVASFIPLGSNLQNNQALIYLIGGLIAYKVFIK